MSFKSARTQCALAVSMLVLAPLTSLTLGQDVKSKTEDPVVKLLEQGATPRQALRLIPKKGMKQTSLMKMKIDQTVVMKGQKLPAVPTPAMQFTVEIAVTDVDGNGDIAFEYTYPKVEIIDESDKPSPAKELMETMLKSLEGLSGLAKISSRGFTRKSEITLPANVSPQIASMIDNMKDSMSRISSPFPEEPIGVGGKWSVTQTIDSNGIKMKQTSTHTLKEIKGQAFDIGIELTQAADVQEVKTPGLPPGTTMKLVSLESTGEGKMLFESGNVFPKSQIKSDSKMGMEMVAGGQTLPMQIEMTLDMTVMPPGSLTEPTK